jgi:hypothetical protein
VKVKRINALCILMCFWGLGFMLTGCGSGNSANSVTLNWPAVGVATSYNVYWAASTGVTTVNGTKIVNAVSPFKHTKLDSDTFPSANTTYFFIVTAVNGSRESLSSSQVSATTSAIDGVGLYAVNCAGCHQPLVASFKKGRSTSQIQTAINTNANMMNIPALVVLTPVQVSAIADVLGF